MIELTDQDVAEFRELFRKETGRDITDDEARAYAWSLIRLAGFVASSAGPAAPPLP
jgi:hypothetical protein